MAKKEKSCKWSSLCEKMENGKKKYQSEKRWNKGTNLCFVLSFIVQSDFSEIHVSEICYMPRGPSFRIRETMKIRKTEDYFFKFFFNWEMRKLFSFWENLVKRKYNQQSCSVPPTYFPHDPKHNYSPRESDQSSL